MRGLKTLAEAAVYIYTLDSYMLTAFIASVNRLQLLHTRV
jgi:hypothetical protein